MDEQDYIQLTLFPEDSPCQPFSVAGKQRGKEDDRYLWPEMVRIIKELRPTWVIGENVAGIVKMALPDILSEMEACGYRTRTFLVPACAVGARHRRYRVAIVAYSGHNVFPKREHKKKSSQRPSCNEPEPCSGGSGSSPNMENTYCIRRGQSQDVCEQSGRTEPERTSETLAHAESQHERRLPIGKGQEKPGFISSSQDVQYSDSAGREEQHSSEKPDNPGFSYRRCVTGTICHTTSERLPDGTSQQMGGYGTPQQEPERSGSKTGEWSAQPGLGGVVNGLPDWVDRYWDIEPDIPQVAAGIPNRVGRLKALGNAVVPQQFYPFFKTIADAMEISYKEEAI